MIKTDMKIVRAGLGTDRELVRTAYMFECKLPECKDYYDRIMHSYSFMEKTGMPFDIVKNNFRYQKMINHDEEFEFWFNQMAHDVRQELAAEKQQAKTTN